MHNSYFAHNSLRRVLFHRFLCLLIFFGMPKYEKSLWREVFLKPRKRPLVWFHGPVSFVVTERTKRSLKRERAGECEGEGDVPRKCQTLFTPAVGYKKTLEYSACHHMFALDVITS